MLTNVQIYRRDALALFELADGFVRPVKHALVPAMCGIAVLVGCVRRIPEPNVAQDVPHISWVLRSGTDIGREQPVCQSDPRTECVLPAGPDSARRFATVSLYMHPVRVLTAYRGSLEVTFVDTPSGVYGTPIDLSVQPGRNPVAATITGLTTSKPGQYVMAIALIAYPAGQVGREIREAVPVVVK